MKKVLKTCNKCGEEKELGEFHNNKSNKDGKAYTCKICALKKHKTYYQENKEDIKAKVVTYALQNKTKIKEYKKNYYVENKAGVIADYNEKNKEAIKKTKKASREKSKEQTKMYNKAYRKENRESIRLYERNKFLTDPNYRIRKSLGSRLTKAVRRGEKKNSIVSLIGCTLDELRIHLERQFKPGMSWENYGLKGWHIDHRVPCNSFDLSKEEEQKACFHFTNLEPLWAFDNLSKNNKLEYLI